ncbi:MAG: hypothetical protein ACNI25_09330 [Halarcobacter sp.]
MKKIFLVFFIVILNTTIFFAYENQKGKIDMHGGKSERLTSKNALNMAVGLGTVLNKKEDKQIEKKDKNFINVDKIEKIENIKEKND